MKSTPNPEQTHENVDGYAELKLAYETVGVTVQVLTGGRWEDMEPGTCTWQYPPNHYRIKAAA